MKPILYILLAAALWTTGCRHVTVLDADALRRPALDFSATGARAAEGALTGQIETGRSTGIGVVAGGCSACN